MLTLMLCLVALFHGGIDQAAPIVLLSLSRGGGQISPGLMARGTGCRSGAASEDGAHLSGLPFPSLLVARRSRMYLALLSHAQRGVHSFLIVAASGGRPGSAPSSSGLGGTGLLQHMLAKDSQEGDARPALRQLELKDADPHIVLEKATLPCPPPWALRLALSAVVGLHAGQRVSTATA